MRIVAKHEGMEWLPPESKIDVILTDDFTKKEFGKNYTVFGFVFHEDNIILLNHVNPNRGIEIPGGHVEEGETLLEALEREVMEEIGCTISHPKEVGLQLIRKISGSEKHPHLLCNQMFFTARLDKMLDIELAPDSLERLSMKIEDFVEYVKDSDKRQSQYYEHLLNEAIEINNKHKPKRKIKPN